MIRSSIWTKTVALGLLVVASVVGNVSLSAANSRLETGRVPTGVQKPDARLFAQPLTRPDIYGGLGSAASDSMRTGEVAESEEPALVAAGEAIGTGENAVDDTRQVVPAIYAWDPDVRFVFYRHVSKWM